MPTWISIAGGSVENITVIGTKGAKGQRGRGAKGGQRAALIYRLPLCPSTPSHWSASEGQNGLEFPPLFLHQVAGVALQGHPRRADRFHRSGNVFARSGEVFHAAADCSGVGVHQAQDYLV